VINFLVFPDGRVMHELDGAVCPHNRPVFELIVSFKFSEAIIFQCVSHQLHRGVVKFKVISLVARPVRPYRQRVDVRPKNKVSACARDGWLLGQRHLQREIELTPSPDGQFLCRLLLLVFQLITFVDLVDRCAVSCLVCRIVGRVS